MERNRYQLSARKVQELESELKDLQTKGRQNIADSLDWLRSLPNDQEDVTFSDVFEDQRYLEKRIVEIREILANTEVVKDTPSSGKVEIGSTVRVGFDKYEEEYTIVNALEADPMNRQISDESPVGRSLIGLQVGDSVVVDTGIVKKEYRVLEIK